MKSKYLLLTIMCALNSIYQAQEYNKSDSVELRDLYMDFSIPKVTAFSLLNVEPNNTLKPGTIKEFALGVGSFVDAKGNFKSGFAMEWSPLMTIKKTRNNFSENNNLWKNFSLSVATAGDSTTGNVAMAFRWVPIDLTNSLNSAEGRKGIVQILEGVRSGNGISEQTKMDLQNFSVMYLNKMSSLIDDISLLDRLDTMLNVSESSICNKLVAKYEVNSITQTREKVVQAMKLDLKKLESDLTLMDVKPSDFDSIIVVGVDLMFDLYEHELKTKEIFKRELLEFKKLYKQENWNKTAFEIGGGQILNSQTSKLRGLSANYNNFYISYAFPLFDKKVSVKAPKEIGKTPIKYQGMLQVRSQMYYTPDSTQNNSLFAGGRFLFGKPNWNVSVECSYNYQSNIILNLNESYVQYAISGEYKLGEGNWIALALGGATVLSNTDRLDLDLIPRIAFRHAFQKESRF